MSDNTGKFVWYEYIGGDLPAAVERLRAVRSDERRPATVLAATDPAQAYGAVLGWPRPGAGGVTAPGPGVVAVGDGCGRAPDPVGGPGRRCWRRWLGGAG